MDKFILVHAGQDFRGNKKPDYLDYERFQSYIDSGKLRVHWIDRFPRFINTTWGREEYQRNEIELALDLIKPDEEDFIIVSDIDEIPKREVLEDIRWLASDIGRFRMNKYSTGINILTDEGNTAAVIFRKRLLDTASPHLLRKADVDYVVENGGWEFSSLGTPEQVELKLKSFSHDELDGTYSLDDLRARMREGKDILGRDINHTIVEIDYTFPEAIKNNREYWSKYEWSD